MIDEDLLYFVALVEERGGVGVGEERRAGEQFAKAEDGLHGEREVAIGGLVDAVGSAEVGVGIIDGRSLRGLATVVEPGREDFELEVEGGFKERDLDQAAAVGDAPADYGAALNIASMRCRAIEQTVR